MTPPIDQTEKNELQEILFTLRRNQKRKSWARIAERMGVSRSAVGYWKEGLYGSSGAVERARELLIEDIERKKREVEKCSNTQ